MPLTFNAEVSAADVAVVQSDVDAHEAETTTAHGGIVASSDSRLSDTRTPTDGSVTAAKVSTALKPSGSAVAGDEALRALGTGATQAAAGNDSRFPTSGQSNALAGTSGTPGSTNKYVTDADSRNTNARTPTAHASSHASAGSDPITPSAIGSLASADFAYAALTSDMTAIHTTTVLADITGLGLAISASATEMWRATWWLVLTAANATMDAQFGFGTMPTGATMKWATMGAPASFASWAVATTATSPTALTETGTFSVGSRAGVFLVTFTAIVYGGGTGGTVQPKYAQATSDAGNLQILKGSNLEARRLAA